MKRFLKFLHELSTVGVMGAAFVQLLLSTMAVELPATESVVMRQAVVLVCDWLLLPSLGVVLASGLLAMAVHRPFHNAQWAWIKAFMTPLVFEATVLAVVTPARKIAKLSAKLADGDASAQPGLDQALWQERSGLIIVLLLFGANVVLAIWRPRFRPKVAPAVKPVAATAESQG